MNKVLILASGGLDSSTIIAMQAQLKREIHLLYVDYGNVNAEMEKSKLKDLVDKYRIEHYTEVKTSMGWTQDNITKDGSSTDGNPYVEMRNLIFLSYAFSYAEAKGIETILVGFIKVPEYYPDTSPDFVDDMTILGQRHIGARVEAPLHNLSKQDVYEMAHSLGLWLADTVSCNTPVNGKPCGKCGDCMDIDSLNIDGGRPQ